MRLSKETIKKVIVSPATIGDKLRLCDVYPYYEYINKVKTDNLLGYNYVVTCSALAGERLSVKIPGKQLLGEESYDKLVHFSGFSIGIYVTYSTTHHGIETVNLKASATGVTVVNG